MALTIVPTITELRTRLGPARAEGRTVGFVPTMGYLHDGHLSLVEAARSTTDVVVVSIFVNPLQFAANEDLGAYPRDLDADVARCEAAGVDLVFAPSVDEMYPVGEVATTVTVGGVSEVLEGASRPTHFAGVATVVAKLFSIVGTCSAFFGEKDFQQLAVVRRMAADLSLAVDVVGCPIVREPDGLAMSSRNVYLDPDERAVAPVLQRALQAGRALIESGERDPAVVEAAMRELVEAEPLPELDYLVAVDAATLRRPEVLSGEVRLLGAMRLGRPRLIDNVGVTIPS
ncbi:MAG: pantoate--beta-alanine ligase [Actinomycetota bacterium]